MFTSVMLFAQNSIIDLPAIDLQELWALAITISVIGIGVGSYSVTALVALVKRWVGAEGVWVVFISIGVSGLCVTAYLLVAGWNWIYFLILTTMVTIIANGIHKKNKRRIKKADK